MLACSYLKEISSFDVVVYTGYTLEQLSEVHGEMAWAHVVDWLVDGPYIDEAGCDSGWRGSKNQRLFRLRRGKISEVRRGFPCGRWSVASPHNDAVYLCGIPTPLELARLEALLASHGLPFGFEGVADDQVPQL